MQVEMGLTWIDHETIDKPIEEMALDTSEIEFHVETLKCENTSQTLKPKKEGGGLSLKVGDTLRNVGLWRNTKGKTMTPLLTLIKVLADGIFMIFAQFLTLSKFTATASKGLG